ncbi:hypothetical protein LIA77_11254 [Sarocladium implicatum]|nr:hypothetical protein LIA77_11254 [Sarocladium implicatum]
MRFVTFIQVLVLAPFTQAFVIPKGTENGVYVVHTDEQGHELHERVGPAVANDGASLEKRSEVSPNPLAKRIEIDYFCGCAFKMDHGYCDAAVAALKADVRNKNGIFPAHSNFYSIQGSVVAFVCNRGTIFGEAPGNLAGYFAAITERCGWYTAGTYKIKDTYHETTYGYMNYYEGLDYCGKSDSASQHSC